MADAFLRKVYGVVEYLGKGYHGWQVQGAPDQHTVSGALTHCLGLLLFPARCTKFVLVGASRTDAGVNARGNAFHIKLHYEKGAIPLSEQDFKDGVNSHLQMLNHNIRVRHIQDVFLGFHAQRSEYKIYEYTLTTRPSIFLEGRSAVVPPSLDVGKVRKAASLLTGKISVKGFSKCSKDANVADERVVDNIVVTEQGTEVRLQFQASGFAWHQVRYMVGGIVECGLGRLSLEELQLLAAGQSSIRPPLASPYGLCLMEVAYNPRQLRPYKDDRLF